MMSAIVRVHLSFVSLSMKVIYLRSQPKNESLISLNFKDEQHQYALPLLLPL